MSVVPWANTDAQLQKLILASWLAQIIILAEQNILVSHSFPFSNGLSNIAQSLSNFAPKEEVATVLHSR